MSHAEDEDPGVNPFVLLLLAIASELVGTMALRASEGFTRPVPSVIVVLGYGAAFYLLSLTLKEIPVGTAYAIWAGLGTAGAAVLSWLIFRDSLGWASVLGIGLIVAGVVVLNLFGRAHA